MPPNEKIERNKLIVSLHLAGSPTGKIIETVKEIYGDTLTQQAVHAIFRRSPLYEPQRNIQKYCNSCLKNYPYHEMYFVRKDEKIIYRFCFDCMKKIVNPESPIERIDRDS